MQVKVIWKYVNGPDDPLWRVERGLYAYFHPQGREILYIGKVDGTPVRQRWNRSAKYHFWNDLKNRRGIHEHAVLVGEIALAPFKRLSIELLEDIESLLIFELKPWGNIQSIESRISREGLTIDCLGDWPLARKSFRDDPDLGIKS